MANPVRPEHKNWGLWPMEDKKTDPWGLFFCGAENLSALAL
jgi:hypothetical protein